MTQLGNFTQKAPGEPKFLGVPAPTMGKLDGPTRQWLMQKIITGDELSKQNGAWAGFIDPENDQACLMGLYPNTRIYIRMIHFRGKDRLEIYLKRRSEKTTDLDIELKQDEDGKFLLSTMKVKEYEWQSNFFKFLVPKEREQAFLRKLSNLAGVESVELVRNHKKKLKALGPFG